ncbi:ATP-grasp fold amidoligase family protein [Panacagrimonas sp.]|uniref:ATP-grasp fold amidoligase family protein n=1 Tax=Panacagrimonas sp. TaxID=2480088 RepID=UPI003B5240F9
MPLLGWRKIRRQVVHGHANRFGRKPNLIAPHGFNERILQRMVHDRDPWLRFAGDKLATREFVSRMAGYRYALPLLGSWQRADRIEWKTLPDTFVFKPNNMSGKIRVVRDLQRADTSSLTALGTSWLRQSYFDVGLEWSYLNTPDRLLAEPVMKSHDGESMIEVNVTTFAGHPAVFEVLTGKKGSNHRCNGWFGAHGQRLDLRGKADPPERVLDASQLQRLIREFQSHREAIADLAQRLGRWFAMMRVDIWITSEGLKVAELTAYPQRGTTPFQPADWDQKLGAMFIDAVRSDPVQPWRRRTAWPSDIPAPSRTPPVILNVQRCATYLRHWRLPRMPRMQT